MTAKAAASRMPEPPAGTAGQNGAGPAPADAVPQIPVLRSVPGQVEERAEAFSINGVTYSIALKPKVNTALRYMHVSRVQGTEAGIDYMLGVLLGEEGYEALMAFDDLTEEQLEAVIKMASQIMAGAVETPKEKRKRG
jgi:hypothetical protein